MNKKDKTEIKNILNSAVKRSLATGIPKSGEFISLKQAAKEYDYARASFYRLREKGLLQFHKIGTGSKAFIKRSEFEALMQPEA